jgi:hypothetical protein
MPLADHLVSSPAVNLALRTPLALKTHKEAFMP